MTQTRVVQVAGPGQQLELVEREIRQPGRGEVLVRVQACGVCHSDAFTVEGGMPIEYPRVPGHEIAGTIQAVGEGVEPWQVGQRVGVGWFGGNCGHCDPCRRGDLISCVNGQVPGIAYDGGYADHVVVPAGALASIPDDLAAVDAAPLLCAGVTTFNALRESGARAGDLVAILGVGGLGHLGVQFARKMGFETVAIARGTDKKEQALQLGAHHYLDSTAVDVAEELQKLGGAVTILATVTAPDAMSSVVGGLRPRGRMVVVGASADPMQIPPFALIPGSTGVLGHASGTSKDSEDTLRFSALQDVRPMVESYPLEQAAEGYDRMMSGGARFRVVLTME
ncbi:alcohol dehydrogenase catalytic domain-containing protein [Nakamurella flavida]|uniref:Alcohol dehydrogenase n=1 Tax=Nakamurella flavida TaxID=363630 RepID=A0A939C3X8_9ACTN|nr:alcohol dehydrogenase [Nakamurella flavida]MBM9477511.1 alcohol dehydrogenase catalytic domain-containing protein [Nakamurella flavida]MDP9777444.1 D-arabinose 1-dehydrogenase-like Zn-dependent alcohol dehydrogenase [Nakamurella flavida]